MSETAELPEAYVGYEPAPAAPAFWQPMPSFESQIAMYPQVAKPESISLMVFDLGAGQQLNSLLWRDELGLIRGVLDYYPAGLFQGLQTVWPVGAINIAVHPDWQRRGIATELLDTALGCWPDLRVEGQQFSRDGSEWMNRYVDRKLGRC